VPVEVEGRVLPQPDTGSVAVAQLRRNAKSTPPAGGLAAAAPAQMAPASAAMDEVAQAPPPPALVDSAEANEGATQIAFTLPYKISVAAGQSLLVPVLDRALPARRIDL